jgi:hypothetical protein
MYERELLQNAAIAIGGTLSEGHGHRRIGETWDEWEWYGPLGIHTKEELTIYPLTDKSDAFQLLIMCGLVFRCNIEHGYVMCAKGDASFYIQDEEFHADIEAACCKVIVMAAGYRE